MDTLSWETSKKTLVGELIKGKGFANKLKNLLQNPVQDHHSESPHQLVMNILTTFSDTISVLSSCDDEFTDDDQIPASLGHVGPTSSGGDRMSACSGESKKRPAGKDRRGCYKRRKTSDSRIIVAPNQEDEYAWRKYGQKEILNAKHPRCYFRCTHKYEQGCNALKQVQKLEDGSNMYHITYFSNHTCKNLARSQLFQDPLDSSSSYLLSFESKRPSTSTKDRTCFAPLVKEEPKQEQFEVSSDDLSSADSNLWKEIIAIGGSSGGIMGFDRDDVVSSMHDHSSSSNYSSSHGLDMEFYLKSVNFDSEFPYGEIE